jgi:hypothetical protein
MPHLWELRHFQWDFFVLEQQFARQLRRLLENVFAEPGRSERPANRCHRRKEFTRHTQLACEFALPDTLLDERRHESWTQPLSPRKRTCAVQLRMFAKGQ